MYEQQYRNNRRRDDNNLSHEERMKQQRSDEIFWKQWYPNFEKNSTSKSDTTAEQKDKDKKQETKPKKQTALKGKALLQSREQLVQKYFEYSALSKTAKVRFKDEGGHDKAANDFINLKQKKEQELKELMELNGFASLGELEAYIGNYEKGFRQKTLKLVRQQLDAYKKLLQEQETKLSEPLFLATLLNQIKSSKAGQYYKNSQNASASASLLDFDEKPPASVQNLKSNLKTKAKNEKQKGNEAIKPVSPKMPLINDQAFDKQKFAQLKTTEELREFLSEYIQNRREDIADVWENLNEDGGVNIYNYPDLITLAKQQQGIKDGGHVNTIINHKISDNQTQHMVNALVLGVLAVALGLLTFGVGTVALLTAGGSFLIGAYLTKEEIDNYQNQLAAYNVNISKDEPSAVWVILAIAGSVMDAATVAKISKQLVNAGHVFENGQNINKTREALKEAGLDEKAIDKTMQALEADAKRLKTAVDEKAVDNLNKRLNNTETLPNQGEENINKFEKNINSKKENVSEKTQEIGNLEERSLDKNTTKGADKKVTINGTTYTKHVFGLNNTELYSWKSGGVLRYALKDFPEKPIASFYVSHGEFHSAIKLADELKKQNIGSSIFFDAFEKLSHETKINEIVGNWSNHVELKDNFESFKNALLSGKTAKEAAFLTATGKCAKKLNFTEVLVPEEYIAQIINGKRMAIEVWFVKNN